VDGVADVAAEGLPPSLRLMILRRVAALGERGAGLLRDAALLGTAFSPAEVASVSGRTVGQVVDDLMEARRAGLVVASGELMRFRHDLVREALYADLPEAARRALHREAARRLAEAGASQLQVAEQLSLGAEVGDREAVSWLLDAARVSQLRAPSVSVALLERAVELAPREDPAREELLAELAEALGRSGARGRGAGAGAWCGGAGAGSCRRCPRAVAGRAVA
jgi:predicted ATPase